MTNAPRTRLLVLYDGQCVFCTTQMARLQRWAQKDALEPRDFQPPGALDDIEGLTWDDCMQAMVVVAPDGTHWRGAEAAARALMTRPLMGKLAWLYYTPGLRWITDRIYAAIAKRRYAIAGRKVAAGECDGGTCQLHFPAPEDPDA